LEDIEDRDHLMLHVKGIPPRLLIGSQQNKPTIRIGKTFSTKTAL
jgi:hypothetical protein